jgi:hypothetical protein
MSTKKNPYKIIPLVLVRKWFDMIAAGIIENLHRLQTASFSR